MQKSSHAQEEVRGRVSSYNKRRSRNPVINCSIFDYKFDHALCDLGASVNIMPKVTFKKLGYPSISPTIMCVQLADFTIRYPEGVVERLMVKVKNTYILVDFVVLDMEGDFGIPLILGRPFLKDANARIDVGRGRISLCIRGRTMKFKFQNKKEVFLIHEDSEKQGLWAEPGWDDQDYHLSSKPGWEDWEIHTPPTELVEDDQKIPDFITNIVWEDLEIVYPTSEDTVPVPPTPPKKIKKVWRKKNKTSLTSTTSPSTDETTST